MSVNPVFDQNGPVDRSESVTDHETDGRARVSQAVSQPAVNTASQSTVHTMHKPKASDAHALKHGRDRLESYSVAELSPADSSQIPSLKRAPICYRKRVGAIVDGAQNKFGQGFHHHRTEQWSVTCYSNPSCTPARLH